MSSAAAAGVAARGAGRLPPPPTAPPCPATDAEEGGGGPASGRKRKKVKVGGGMRKTRGMIEAKARGPKVFRCGPRAAAPLFPARRCSAAWRPPPSPRPLLAPIPPPHSDFLEEADLESLPEGEPSYLTAAVGPPRTTAPRKFCSVCGDCSVYTCTRCGSRYCRRARGGGGWLARGVRGSLRAGLQGAC